MPPKKMKSVWKRHKIKIIMFGYLILIYFISQVAIFPLVEKIRSKRDAIQESLLDNQANASRISKIPEMNEDNNLYLENKKALGAILLPEEEVNFFEKLETIARSTRKTPSCSTLWIRPRAPKVTRKRAKERKAAEQLAEDNWEQRKSDIIRGNEDRTQALVDEAEAAGLEFKGAGTTTRKSINEKILHDVTAKKILAEAGGDKEKARKIAKERGYKF